MNLIVSDTVTGIEIRAYCGSVRIGEHTFPDHVFALIAREWLTSRPLAVSDPRLYFLEEVDGLELVEDLDTGRPRLVPTMFHEAPVVRSIVPV